MSIIGNTVKPSIGGSTPACNTIPPSWLVAHYKLTGTAEDVLDDFNGGESSATYVYDNERGVVYAGGGSITIPDTSGASCTYWIDDGTGWTFLYSVSIPTSLDTDKYSNLVCYNKELTSSEQDLVKSIQNSIHNIPIDNGLIAYYPLDGNSLDNAISQADGTDSGVSYVYDSEMDKVVLHGEHSSSSTTTDIKNVDITQDFTIMGWAKRDSAQSDTLGYEYHTIISDGYYSSSSSVKGFWLCTTYGDTKKPEFRLMGDGSNTRLKAPDVLPDDEWFHMVGIRKGTTVSIVINGNEVASDTVSNVLNSSYTTRINSYSDDNSMYYGGGDISNLRIYNRPLSQQEIETIYEYEKPSSTLCLPDITVDNPDPFGDGSGVALYKLDGDATDAGSNYDGTATDVAYNDGMFGQCGVFNGSSSKITVPAASGIDDTIRTTSVWVKDIGTNTKGRVLTFGVTGSSDNYSWYTFKYDADYLQMGWIAIDGGIRDGARIEVSNVPSTGWVHIVHVFGAVDSGSHSVYINGSSINVGYLTSTSAMPDIKGNNNIGWFERDSVADVFGNAIIDQVRIFNRALTQEEVTILYNERKQ